MELFKKLLSKDQLAQCLTEVVSLNHGLELKEDSDIAKLIKDINYE